MLGRILAVFILSLLTGMILGALVFNYYYQISERLLEKYDLFFVLFPAAAMFFAGFLAGRAGRRKAFEYRPMFQGKPRQLGQQDGERLVLSALRRVGLVKEEGKR